VVRVPLVKASKLLPVCTCTAPKNACRSGFDDAAASAAATASPPVVVVGG
jgi:hypothetical protein